MPSRRLIHLPGWLRYLLFDYCFARLLVWFLVHSRPCVDLLLLFRVEKIFLLPSFLIRFFLSFAQRWNAVKSRCTTSDTFPPLSTQSLHLAQRKERQNSSINDKNRRRVLCWWGVASVHWAQAATEETRRDDRNVWIKNDQKELNNKNNDDDDDSCKDLIKKSRRNQQQQMDASVPMQQFQQSHQPLQQFYVVVLELSEHLIWVLVLPILRFVWASSSACARFSQTLGKQDKQIRENQESKMKQGKCMKDRARSTSCQWKSESIGTRKRTTRKSRKSDRKTTKSRRWVENTKRLEERKEEKMRTRKLLNEPLSGTSTEDGGAG